MANLSDARVHITSKNVGKELIDYIKATNDNGVEYNIMFDSPTIEELGDDGELDYESQATGRWAYECNLEGYFSTDEDRTRKWLGVDYDYSWNKHLSPEYIQKRKEDSERAFAAYKNLIKAIKEKNGAVYIDYQDSEQGNLHLGSGSMSLEMVDNELTYSHNFEPEEFTVIGFARMQGESEYWALEYLYGEDVAAEYDKYVEEWKKNNEFKPGDSEPAGPSEWYDHEYQEA